MVSSQHLVTRTAVLVATKRTTKVATPDVAVQSIASRRRLKRAAARKRKRALKSACTSTTVEAPVQTVGPPVDGGVATSGGRDAAAAVLDGSPSAQPAANEDEDQPAEAIDNKLYDVYAVIDRRYECGYQYLVLWTGEKREQTWEPRARLISFGLTEEVSRVDRWKLQGDYSDFYDYCKTLKLLVGSSTNGRCMFTALALAVGELQMPGWYSEDHVQAYLNKSHNPTHMGVTYENLRFFIDEANRKAHRQRAPQLSTKSFKKSWLVDSVRTVDAFMRLSIPDGIFLCAVRLTARGGHCFMLRIKDGRKTAADAQEPEQDFVTFIKSWSIFGFLFVRKVEILQR